jgi:hypothetical protein
VGVEEANVGFARTSPQLLAADAASARSEGRIADVVVDVGKESVEDVELLANHLVRVIFEPSQLVRLKLIGRGLPDHEAVDHISVVLEHS